MKTQACQLLCKGKEKGTRAVLGLLVGPKCLERLIGIAADAGVPASELAELRDAPDVGERPAFWTGGTPRKVKKPKAEKAKGAARPAATATPRVKQPAAPPPPAIENYVCQGCTTPFTRKRQPGRKPRFGPCCPAAKRPTHLAHNQRPGGRRRVA